MGSKYFHFTGLGCSLYLRMYRMSFLLRSDSEVKTPRAITSRSILANHNSTLDARHGHVRDFAAKFGSELTRGPVRRAVGGLVLGRAGQHASLDAVCNLVAFAPGMPSDQTCQAIDRKALAPTLYGAVAAIELGSDFGPRQAVGAAFVQAARRLDITVQVVSDGLDRAVTPILNRAGLGRRCIPTCAGARAGSR